MQLPQLPDEIMETIFTIADHIIEEHDGEEVNVRLTYRGYEGRYYVDCSCGRLWKMSVIRTDIVGVDENIRSRHLLESFFREQAILKKMVEYRKKRLNKEQIVKRANSAIGSLEV